MYALVETGGKQYRLSPGDALNVEKLEGEVGATLVLGKVLMVVDDDGTTTIGGPIVEGVDVTAEIVAHGRGRKIVVFKYKPKVNYRRKQGHRQPYTRVRVTAIGAPTSQAAAVPDEAAAEAAPTAETVVQLGAAAAPEPAVETGAVAPKARTRRSAKAADAEPTEPVADKGGEA